MVGNNIGLDRLCLVYEKLDDRDKEKVIRLAQILLNTQKITKDENMNSREKVEKNERRIKV